MIDIGISSYKFVWYNVQVRSRVIMLWSIRLFVITIIYFYYWELFLCIQFVYVISIGYIFSFFISLIYCHDRLKLKDFPVR